MARSSAAKNILTNGNAVHPKKLKKDDRVQPLHDNISLVSISTVSSNINVTQPQQYRNAVPPAQPNGEKGALEDSEIRENPKVLITDHSGDESDFDSRCGTAEPPKESGLSSSPTAAAKWIKAGKQVRQVVAVTQALNRPETRQEKVRKHLYGSKASLPVLPVHAAVLLLVLNTIVPGLGTIISGFTFLCCATTYDKPDRKGIGEKIPNLICTNFLVGIAQLFTVTFILVGWFWSIAWGVTMVQLAKERQREKEEGSDWFPDPIA